MAWSYRNDAADETYANTPGPALVDAQPLPETPASAEHAQDMLDPSRVEKREKEAAKSHEQAEKDKKEGKPTAQQQFDKARADHQTRIQIRAEEKARLEQEERDKELEKIRKEEADNVKKEMNKSHAHSASTK